MPQLIAQTSPKLSLECVPYGRQDCERSARSEVHAAVADANGPNGLPRNGRVHLDDLDGCDAPVLVVQEPGVSVLSKPPYALTQAA